MRTLATIGLMLSLTILVTPDAFAQGRGGGGQRGMRGRSGASQYGNTQAGSMQRQMMQNRYWMMQSGMGGQNGVQQQKRLRNGSCGGQIGSGGAIDATQMQRLQNRARRNQ